MSKSQRGTVLPSSFCSVVGTGIGTGASTVMCRGSEKRNAEVPDVPELFFIAASEYILFQAITSMLFDASIILTFYHSLMLQGKLKQKKTALFVKAL